MPPTLPSARLLAVGLLLALAPPAAAQAIDLPADLDRWLLVYDQADATIFLDTDSIVQSEGLITAWTWWAFDEDQSYNGLPPFDRKLDQSVLDCAGRSTLLLQTEDFNNGRSIDYFEDYDDQWDAWAEGSANETVGEAACTHLGVPLGEG